MGWRVVFYRGGTRYHKTFTDEKPTPAIEFAKRAKRAGYSDVNVHATKRGYPCPTSKLKLREPGLLWCPYCLKWREFKYLAVRFSTGISEPDLRCPVCYITPRDYYVRVYNIGNPLLERVEKETSHVIIRVTKDSAASMSNIKRRTRGRRRS